MRSCLKIAGPGEMILMPSAMSPISGSKIGEVTRMQTTSRQRFQGGIGAVTPTIASETLKALCCIGSKCSGPGQGTERQSHPHRTGCPQHCALAFVDGHSPHEIIENLIQ